MATSKKVRPTVEPVTDKIGLLAFGSSGSWDISIDETTTGKDRWFAQIDGPTVCFYFEIPELGVVEDLLHILEPRRLPGAESVNGSIGSDESLALGKDKQTPVFLIRDNEYDDRFFVVIGPPDSPIVRFTIAGSDVVEIADALRQVMDDLEDE